MNALDVGKTGASKRRAKKLNLIIEMNEGSGSGTGEYVQERELKREPISNLLQNHFIFRQLPAINRKVIILI